MNQGYNFGRTTLLIACEFQHEGIVRMLISSGKVVSNRSTNNVHNHIRSTSMRFAFNIYYFFSSLRLYWFPRG